MREPFVRRGARRAAPGIITSLGLLAAAVTAETTAAGVALAQGGPSAPAAQGDRGNPVPPAVQGNPPPPAATEGRGQAPLGHRQPRPEDLPPAVQREEGGMARSPADRELDQKLQICRGC